MYIRSRVVKGHTYYQLVEGRREGGKVRQMNLLALGRHPTLAGALVATRRKLARMRWDLARLRGPASESWGRGQVARLHRKVAAAEAFVATAEGYMSSVH